MPAEESRQNLSPKFEQRLNEVGPDRGPIYTETPDFSSWTGGIAEPYNAFSAALFVLITLIWLVRLRKRWKTRPLMSAALPILFIGGVGGTLYHGLRNWVGWFLMDLLPIMLLCLMVAIYFWIRLKPRWSYVILMIVVGFIIQGSGRLIFSRALAINFSYAMLALLVLLPIGIVVVRTRFYAFGWLITSFICFTIAWFFRLVDAQRDPPWLPMGTHWLWHTFGAFCVAALAEYIDRVDDKPLSRSPSEKPVSQSPSESQPA